MDSSPVLTESLQDDTLRTRYDLGQHVKMASEAGAEVRPHSSSQRKAAMLGTAYTIIKRGLGLLLW